jgi:hypothetical protein
MNWQTIVIIIVAFGIGYGFAMLDRRVTAGMKQNREDAKREAKVVEKVVPEKSALSLVLDEQDQPNLRLDGVPLVPGQATADQRKRLIWLLNLTRPWIDAPAGPSRVLRDSGAAPVAAAPAVFPPAVTPTPQISVVQGVRAMMHHAVITDEPSHGTGIVRQIDEVLQEKLPASPYASKEIHLEEGPAGEVYVLVGAQKFSGIDAVSDPGIQAIIREAVSEWEKRAGR